MSPAPAPSVSLANHCLSGWQARWPRLFTRLGNLETRLLAEQLANRPVTAPLYISGLARSGTTILLELLSGHPDLVSHRYRDFPPVLTPWLWNWFVTRASKAEQPARERAHGDGIAVTRDSPEAFEEVIWMAFFNDLHNPRVSSVLDGCRRHAGFERFYREHLQKLLLIRGGRRYLSKGNYNISRLGYLQTLFPDARFLLPVRDPVWHIASLIKQHRLFSDLHRRNPRLQAHMSRAGHFEFGLDRRPINTGNSAVTQHILTCWQEGREVEGWARYWADVYGQAAAALQASEGLRAASLLVDYEQLCASPGPVMAAVLRHCGLDDPGGHLQSLAAKTLQLPRYYQPDFEANEIDLIETLTRPVADALAALLAAQD